MIQENKFDFEVSGLFFVLSGLSALASVPLATPLSPLPSLPFATTSSTIKEQNKNPIPLSQWSRLISFTFRHLLPSIGGASPNTPASYENHNSCPNSSPEFDSILGPLVSVMFNLTNQMSSDSLSDPNSDSNSKSNDAQDLRLLILFVSLTVLTDLFPFIINREISDPNSKPTYNPTSNPNSKSNFDPNSIPNPSSHINSSNKVLQTLLHGFLPNLCMTPDHCPTVSQVNNLKERVSSLQKWSIGFEDYGSNKNSIINTVNNIIDNNNNDNNNIDNDNDKKSNNKYSNDSNNSDNSDKIKNVGIVSALIIIIPIQLQQLDLDLECGLGLTKRGTP